VKKILCFLLLMIIGMNCVWAADDVLEKVTTIDKDAMDLLLANNVESEIFIENSKLIIVNNFVSFYNSDIFNVNVKFLDNGNLDDAVNLDLSQYFVKYGYRYWVTSIDDGSYVIITIGEDFALDNLSCGMVSISDDLTTVSNVDCDLDNINKYFSDVVYEYENNLNDKYYDIKDNKFVVIDDDGSLKYSEDGNIVFKVDDLKDNESFGKVAFFDDKIIVIKNIEIDFSGTYSDKVLIYDLNGNVLQEISDNSDISSFAISEDEKEVLISNEYLGGCSHDGYLGSEFFGHDSYGNYIEYCNNYYTYTIYKLNENNGILGDLTDVIKNPDTKDVAILLTIMLFVINFIIFIKLKKIEI